MIAHLLEVIDLGGQHTEDKLILLAGGVGDLDVCAVRVPSVMAPFSMNFMLPVPGSLGACQREMRSETSAAGIRCSARETAVLFQMNTRSFSRTAGSLLIGSPGLQIVRMRLLGHMVAGSSLCAEDMGLGDEVGVGVLLRVQVLKQRCSAHSGAGGSLVHTLDLAVEDGVGVDD